MTTEKQNTLSDQNMRVRGEKVQRIKKVKRKYAEVNECDTSDTAILDEALEIGLSRMERKLGKS